MRISDWSSDVCSSDLHHVGAVLAGEREIGFEGEVAVNVLDLLDQFLRGLRRMAADLEQGEDEAGEFMAHGKAREGDDDVRAGAADHEIGRASWRDSVCQYV